MLATSSASEAAASDDAVEIQAPYSGFGHTEGIQIPRDRSNRFTCRRNRHGGILRLVCAVVLIRDSRKAARFIRSPGTAEGTAIAEADRQSVEEQIER